jgi:transketolase
MICTTKKIKLLLHQINTYISFIMSNTQQLQDFTQQVRRDILRMVHAVNSGHPGGSLGCAEFLVTLYQHVMKRNEGFDMNGMLMKIFSFYQTDIFLLYFTVF